MAALAVAECVGEEQLGVALIGFDQHDVGVGVGALVVLQAEREPRMDHGAEGLAEHRRQPPVDDAGDAALFGRQTALHDLLYFRQGSVERHQRIHAQDQVHAVSQRRAQHEAADQKGRQAPHFLDATAIPRPWQRDFAAARPLAEGRGHPAQRRRGIAVAIWFITPPNMNPHDIYVPFGVMLGLTALYAAIWTRYVKKLPLFSPVPVEEVLERELQRRTEEA